MNKPECLGLLTLETSMIVMYEFGIIRWNQKTEKNQKYVTGINFFYSLHKNGRHLLIHCKRLLLRGKSIKSYCINEK